MSDISVQEGSVQSLLSVSFQFVWNRYVPRDVLFPLHEYTFTADRFFVVTNFTSGSFNLYILMWIQQHWCPSASIWACWTTWAIMLSLVAAAVHSYTSPPASTCSLPSPKGWELVCHSPICTPCCAKLGVSLSEWWGQSVDVGSEVLDLIFNICCSQIGLSEGKVRVHAFYWTALHLCYFSVLHGHYTSIKINTYTV